MTAATDERAPKAPPGPAAWTPVEKYFTLRAQAIERGKAFDSEVAKADICKQWRELRPEMEWHLLDQLDRLLPEKIELSQDRASAIRRDEREAKAEYDRALAAAKQATDEASGDARYLLTLERQRNAELEAKLAALAERVDALTPKPKPKPEWQGPRLTAAATREELLAALDANQVPVPDEIRSAGAKAQLAELIAAA